MEIEVGAEPPLDAVQHVLSKVPGVKSVVNDERDTRLLVVRAETDVRADIVRALVDAGHTPSHLRRRGDELDEIYRRYFAADPGDVAIP
jgi:ABC-2 type transport system ATP-binding protein